MLSKAASRECSEGLLAYTLDFRLPKLCVVLLTHLDRLIAQNRKDLVLPLPRQIGHLILPMESPEKGLGAIRTIMIDVRT